MNNERKPVALGKVDKIPPGVPDRPARADDINIDSCTFYANGETLNNPVADYADLHSLKAATIPAGRYATCSAYGAIKFGDDEKPETKAD